MRRFAALISVPLLVFAACGDDDGDDEPLDPEEFEFEPPEPVEAADDDPLLDAVDVTGDFGEKPDVELEEPIETEETVRRVLIEGDGELVDYGEEFGIDLVVLDAETGEELEETYSTTMLPLVPMDEWVNPGLARAILDVPMGSRVVAAIGPEDIVGPEGAPEAEAETLVVVLDLQPREERAADNEPDGDLPDVSLFNFGVPDVEVPDEEPPSDLVDVVLVEGDGEEVPEGAQVVVNYLGVLWDDGSTFDSSWDVGQPIDLGGVVEGWSEGLAGQDVGSVVLLVVPPEMGYGSEGSAGVIGPDETLVFVVEILEVMDPAEMFEDMPEAEIEE